MQIMEKTAKCFRGWPVIVEVDEKKDENRGKGWINIKQARDAFPSDPTTMMQMNKPFASCIVHRIPPLYKNRPKVCSLGRLND
ncbi:hypothetical protein JS44_06780 [Anoxybacillus flavithermus]|uniref:Uncharacterized protein n=1 Tax=Anoxybacillus flavithermus TaxID=33934 RepID=A0A094IZD7_9BACL|nr:hypothetical protein JS44_06780 [Anoxybacillus flavithermus]